MTARRARLVALVLALFVAIVVFAPQLPPVRAWLLEQGQEALARQGYVVAYDQSAGNPWSGIRLFDAEVTGPGVDVSVERLRVGWFLPSLLASELPLSIAIDGLRGDVDVSEFPTADGSGGDLPITPVLEEVIVQDVALTVNDAPFTIPDLTLADLRLEQMDARFAFETEVHTANGSLRAAGEIGLAPFTLAADVSRADITLARHWWNGASGGTAQGTVRVDGDGVRADLEVQDGALDWLGLDGRDISGPVRYRHPVVSGELAGTVLGGAVTADATVDIGARRWQGTLTGAAGLPEAAGWITRNMAFDPEVLELTGDASYTLNAVGWRTVTLEGDASGAGAVRGMSLDYLAADIRYASGEGIAVDATGDLAGGDIMANVASTGAGIRVRAGASGVDLGLARVPTADLDLTFTPEGLRGDGSLALTASLLERDASVTVDLAADAEGLQIFAEGSAGAATFTGATVLDGNELDGGARIVGLAPESLSGAPVVAVTWSGPLDALAVAVDVESEQPVRPELAGVGVDIDLRGRATGTVTDLKAFDLTGAFGALDVAATGDLQSGTVTASLAEAPVTGRVQTRASLPTVSISYDRTGIDLAGRLEHDVLTAAGVTLEPAAWTVDGTLGATTVITANAVDTGASVVWRPPALSVSLDGLRATVAERSATLEGDLSVVPSEGLGTVRGDLTATLPEGNVTIAADRDLEVDARLPAGFRAGPVALSEPLDLTGAFDPVAGTLAASGTVGDVTLDVRAELGATPTARIDVQSGEEQLTVTLGEAGLTAQGRLEVGPVARAFGFQASGTVAADLGVQDGRYVGSAQIEAVSPVPFEAELVGAGAVVRATVSAALGGQRIALAGTVVPELRLEGVAGPLEGVVIDGSTLAGSGRLARLALGPVTVPAQPWDLQGGLADGRAVLVVGASTLTATWSDGLDVRADVTQPLVLGAADATLYASATWSPANPEGAVEGRLELAPGADDAGEGPLATFQGSLEGVSFEVLAAAGTLAGAFGAPDVVRGDVRLTGSYDPETVSLVAAGTWRAGTEAADLSLTYAPDAGLRASMETDGVTVAWTPDTLMVGGVDGDLAPFVTPALLASAGLETLEISGRLQRADGLWTGTVDVDTGIPGSSITVTGVEDRLVADARLAIGDGALQATGTVLPDLGLSLSGRLGPLTLAGVLSGPYDDLAVDAAIELEPVNAGPVALDGTRIAVQGTVAPLDLRLAGPGTDVRIVAGGPAGAIALQGRVAGEPQTALVDLSGNLVEPVARAELIGPVSGTVSVSRDGARATLAVAPETIPGAVPIHGPILVNATADASLAWQADVRADASVAGANVALFANVSGERLAYSGQGRIATDGGTVVGLTLRGQGADATLVVDAAELEAGALGPVLPVDHALGGTGRLEVRTSPFAITGGLGLDGSLGGMPATVAVTLPEGAGLDLSARVGPVAITAQSEDLRTIAVSVASDGAADAMPNTPPNALSNAIPNAVVDAEVRLSESTIEVAGTGTLAGEPLAIGATWWRSPADAGPARPRLVASVRSSLGDLDLELAGPVSPTSGWTVAVDARTDAGPVPAGATLEGTLDLAGPTAPALRLGGDLSLTGHGLSFDVDLGAQPNLVLVSLEAAGLVVRASAGSDARPGAPGAPDPDAAIGFQFWAVAASGAGTLDVAGVAATVDATDVLTWSPDAGFGGSARVEVQAPGVTDRLGGAVALRLQGDEALTVTLAAPAELATGTLRLSRAPWSDPRIEGAVQIDIPSTSLASWPRPAPTGSSAVDAAIAEASGAAAATPAAEPMDAFAAPDLPGVEASIEIAGELGSPRAQGTLKLTGPIEADGSLRYVDGAGRVDVTGADLDLLARANAAGWSVEATLDGADLGALPLASPRVSGRIQAEGGWTRLERATLTGVEIETAGGTISAEGSLADEVAVALRVDLPLRDLETGPDLVGRVQGPVVVRMPALDAWTQADVQAALELDGFGVASIGGRLAGDVGVSGTWPDLAAYAHLEGTDGATGTLDLDADLAESRLDIESTLAWAGIESDLRVDVTSRSWTAAGTLEYRDLGLRLGTENGAIALEGFGGLAGWRGGIDPAAWALDATGPVASPLAALASGAPEASGTATLRARIEPSPAGTVRIEGLTVAGLRWGDVQATFAGLDAPIEIEGTYVDARVALGGVSVEDADGQTSEQTDGAPGSQPAGRSWSLVLTELPVLPDASLSANAQGTGTVLTGSATLSGTYVDAPLAMAMDVALDDVWRIQAEGRALGGTVDVDAQRAELGAWTGTVELGGATLAGSTLTLEGVLTGSDLVPTLVANTSIAGAVDATGTLQASRDVLEVDQRVSVRAVGRDVSVQGRLWPAIDATVRIAGEDATGEALQLKAGSWSEPLTASGATSATVAGFDVRLAGGADRPEGDALRVQLDAPLEGLRFTGALAPRDASVLDVIETVRSSGIILTAEGRAAGTLAATATPFRAVLDDLRYEHPSGAQIALSGPVSVGDADLTGTLVVPELDFLAGFEGLPANEHLPFRVTGIDGEGYALSLVTPAGTLGATYRLGGDGIGLIADLALGGGSVRADLSVSPAAGVHGEIALAEVTVPTAVAAQPLVLDGTVRGMGSEVELALRGAIGGSSAQANGVWSLAGIVPSAWVPDAWVQEGGGRRNLELRLRSFDPTTLPAVAGRVPNLTVPLSGVLTLEPNQVFGRVVAPELRVADETLPLSLDVTGTFAEILVQGTLGRSTIQLTANADAIEGYMRLESFPSHLGIEALVGDTDVSAEVTGVLRGTLSLGGEGVSELRLATERIRLERDGVVTTGNVAISWIDGVLTVEEAEFEGVGTYRASGVIRPNELDFSLRAEDADFGPLLGLVPTLAQLSTDANGNLVIDATGSLGDPRIDVTVADLAVEIAGGSYRIPSAQVDVTGTELRIEGVVEGLAPIDGRVPFAGGGRIEFVPFRLGRVELGLGGRAEVPALGEVSDLDGTVAFGGGAPPRLDLVGSVGNPLRVSGTLAPLDLRIQGDDLAVRSPTFLLASSVLDINASLIQERGSTGTIWVVRGGIFADQARFELGIREVDPSGSRERNPALERVVFDSVQIQAPRQLQLTENFGTLEGRADLTLVGTAATPNLVGRASAVRGNVRFFGRDFTLLSAEAVFDRTRGIYPSVSLEARTTADKSRVLAGIADTVRFVVPREGGSFEIDLAISGEVEPTPQADRAFRVQVETELSSDARIEVQGESAIASGPRPLLDSELLAVITLGRLEINPNLAAEQGVASAVAGTALDTVVDYLVVSELQRGLSEALGVDVVEIRTSNLSQVFTGDGQDPFSVSFRLGGYLTEDLFASYRIGRFDDASATLGLTNEVRFTYELGPVAFDLAGSVGFEATGTGTPVPGLSAAVRYEITPLIDLETSVDLSNAGSRARFGVTLRW